MEERAEYNLAEGTGEHRNPQLQEKGQLSLPEAESDQDALVAMLETLLSQIKHGK